MKKRNFEPDLRPNLRGGVYAGGGVVSLHRGSTCGGRDSDTFRRPGDSAIVRAEREEDSAVCGVQKDSGDDPDVTNGTLVCARAVLACHDSITESGYTDPAYPGIEVTGGEGIGMVTRDGLSCPVGHYAINPYRGRLFSGRRLCTPGGGHAGVTFAD